MTHEQINAYLEQTFDSFCKTVIRNKSRNIHKRLKLTAQHEISLACLSTSEAAQLITKDDYGVDKQLFHVEEGSFSVDNSTLAYAISYLTPQRREIILLSFFLGYSDTQISRKLNVSPDTICYRRNIAIKKLKELLGGVNDD